MVHTSEEKSSESIIEKVQRDIRGEKSGKPRQMWEKLSQQLEHIQVLNRDATTNSAVQSVMGKNITLSHILLSLLAAVFYVP